MISAGSILAISLVAGVCRAAAAQPSLPIVEGTVLYQSGGAGPWTPAAAGQSVGAKDGFLTGPASSAVLAFPGGTKVLLHSGTTAYLESAGEHTASLRVASGELEAWVRGGLVSTLSVKTPVSYATFNGATFRVLVDGSGASAWDVFEADGKIRVDSVKSGDVRLTSGGHVAIDRAALVSPDEFIETGLPRTPEPHFAGEVPPPTPPAEKKKD